DDWTGDLLFSVVNGASNTVPNGLYFGGNVNLGKGLASSFTADLSAYAIESMTVDPETSDLYFIGFPSSGPIVHSLYRVDRARGTTVSISQIPPLGIAFAE